MSVKYTSDDIINITTFENITKSSVIDYLKENGTLYYVIKSNNFRALIGPNGLKIKEIQQKMNQTLKIYRYSDNIEEFTKNLIMVPTKKIELEQKDNQKTIIIETENINKGLLIGRDGKNIKIIKTFLKRQFNIDNIKII